MRDAFDRGGGRSSQVNSEMHVPIKTREIHNHHMDSTIWNRFRFRYDDIVIATYGKSCTTWLQQIVAQLLFADGDDRAGGELSPWLDLSFPPAISPG